MNILILLKLMLFVHVTFNDAFLTINYISANLFSLLAPLCSSKRTKNCVSWAFFQSYVFGVVVWYLSLRLALVQIRDFFIFAFPFAIVNVFYCCLRMIPYYFSFVSHTQSYWSSALFRQSRLVSRRKREKRSALVRALAWFGISFRRPKPKKPSRCRQATLHVPQTHAYRSVSRLRLQQWLQRRKVRLFDLDEKKWFSFIRGRVVRPSFRGIRRQLPQLSQRLRWFGSVFVLPYVHYFFLQLSRWPLPLLLAFMIPPVLVHTALWIVQDYEITYSNLFTGYNKAYYQLFAHQPPTYFGSTVLCFITTLLRMYINALSAFYFETFPHRIVLGGQLISQMLSDTVWSFLFVALCLALFFSGYGGGYWAEFRFLRKYEKKYPRSKFRANSHIFFGRLKVGVKERKRRMPVHPDKGRSDSGFILLVATFSIDSFLNYYVKFLSWFTCCVEAFSWAHFVVTFFVLACVFLHFATSIVVVFTSRLLYARRIHWVFFVVNLTFLFVFAHLVFTLWTTWMTKYANRGGPFADMYDFIFHHLSGRPQLIAISCIAVSIFYGFYRLYQWARARKHTDYICGIYITRSFKWRRVNDAALERLITHLVHGLEVDRARLRRPLELDEKDRYSVKPKSKKPNKS